MGEEGLGPHECGRARHYGHDRSEDLRIDVFNELGERVMSNTVYRAGGLKYRAIPEPDANATVVAIDEIKLKCKGCDRTPT